MASVDYVCVLFQGDLSAASRKIAKCHVPTVWHKSRTDGKATPIEISLRCRLLSRIIQKARLSHLLDWLVLYTSRSSAPAILREESNFTTVGCLVALLRRRFIGVYTPRLD